MQIINPQSPLLRIIIMDQRKIQQLYSCELNPKYPFYENKKVANGLWEHI